MRFALSALALFPAVVAACGGGRPKTDAPASPAADATSSAAPAESASAAPAESEPTMPTKCASSGDMCTPPNDFVTRLCNKNFLEATLVLFAKDSPWTRAYLKGAVDAWYPDGASMRAKLQFDEEVIVLRKRTPPKGGMVVGDSNGSYDVLRWDGYCYSLDAGEVTTKAPPSPKRPLIKFFKLGKRMQDAMLESKTVTAAYAKRMKECGGATAGEVTIACEKADAALSAAAIEFVRATSTLPPPDKIP